MVSKRLVQVLIALLLPSVLSADIVKDAQALFAEGADLIDRNHHGSMGATQESLERGIELVRRATELGYPDLEGAYLTLAEALNDLAFSFYEGQQAKFDDLTHHRDQIYRRLLATHPHSARVLTANAFLTRDAQAREALLRRAVEADPSHADSSFTLGMDLIRRGDFEEGIPLARQGVENCEVLILRAYGGDLLELLRSSGLESEAKDFENRYRELLKSRLGSRRVE